MSSFLENLPAQLEPVEPAGVPGFAADRFAEGWRAFAASCARQVRDGPVLRTGHSSLPGMLAAAELALRVENPTESDVRSYFTENFSIFRIRPRSDRNPHPHGFVTGYYEPEVAASRVRAPGFDEPARGRPADLVQATIEAGPVTYTGARRNRDGQLKPYWSRAEIDAGLSGAPEILWVRDAIELFMIQVQGSARVTLPDTTAARLVYDGRNGRPYESIGRILVAEGHIALADMSLDVLKNWVRQAGQEPGAPGRNLLHRNPSYIFFRLVEDMDPALGPTGGEGVPLTKLRSMAIDRSIWPYGLPFFVNGRLPLKTGREVDFQRLLVAQDTGSAIVGAARGYIFFGSGDAAGQAAALVRHPVDMFVLLPRA